jgi:hypothetical protein
MLCVIWQTNTNASEESAATIFRVEQQAVRGSVVRDTELGLYAMFDLLVFLNCFRTRLIPANYVQLAFSVSLLFAGYVVYDTVNT